MKKSLRETVCLFIILSLIYLTGCGGGGGSSLNGTNADSSVTAVSLHLTLNGITPSPKDAPISKWILSPILVAQDRDALHTGRAGAVSPRACVASCFTTTTTTTFVFIPPQSTTTTTIVVNPIPATTTALITTTVPTTSTTTTIIPPKTTTTSALPPGPEPLTTTTYLATTTSALTTTTAPTTTTVLTTTTSAAPTPQPTPTPGIVSSVSITVSAPDIAPIQTTSQASGNGDIYLSLNVPNGKQRSFSINVMDATGKVIYKGATTADLNGTPITLVINLVAA